MRSTSCWLAKTRADILAKGAKVQSTNNTVNVDIGLVCKALDYTQLVFTRPRCQATCGKSPASFSLFGGIPSSNGPILSGGGPSSNGPVLSGGGPSSNSPVLSGGGPSSNGPVLSGGGPSSNGPVLSGGGPSSNGPVLSGGNI